MIIDIITILMLFIVALLAFWLGKVVELNTAALDLFMKRIPYDEEEDE